MMRGRRWAAAVVTVAMLAVAGCAGSDVTEPPGEQRVASVVIVPNPFSVAVGRTLQLTAMPRAKDGSPLTGRAVTWSSSDTAIAMVSASGVVTGIATGTATITSTSEAVSGTASVTVTSTPTGGTQLTWTGSASTSNWFAAGNWMPAGVPGAADTVRIPAASPTSVLSGNAEIARLIVSGGVLRTAGHTLAIRRP